MAKFPIRDQLPVGGSSQRVGQTDSSSSNSSDSSSSSIISHSSSESSPGGSEPAVGPGLGGDSNSTSKPCDRRILRNAFSRGTWGRRVTRLYTEIIRRKAQACMVTTLPTTGPTVVKRKTLIYGTLSYIWTKGYLSRSCHEEQGYSSGSRSFQCEPPKFERTPLSQDDWVSEWSTSRSGSANLGWCDPPGQTAPYVQSHMKKNKLVSTGISFWFGTAVSFVWSIGLGASLCWCARRLSSGIDSQARAKSVAELASLMAARVSDVSVKKNITYMWVCRYIYYISLNTFPRPSSVLLF